MEITGMNSCVSNTVRTSAVLPKNENTPEIRSEDLCMDIDELKDFFYTTGMLNVEKEDDQKELWA